MGEINPFFSVIVPVYNSSEYIQKCIESILCQKFKNYEVIFVDDGSNDDSISIISKYLKEYTNFKLLKQENKGVSAARNTGLINATGEYILFMDSDDYWESGILDRLSKVLLANENVDILLFNYFEDILNTRKDHYVSTKFIGERISKNLAIESIMSNKGYLGYCWNKVFKRSSIKNNRFDESITYLEDMLFNITCILNAHEIVSINDELYAYRWRPDSVVNTFDSKHMTFFDSLDKISKIIPNEFVDAIIIKKKAAYIEFASNCIFKNRKEFKSLKDKFNQEKKITNIKEFGLLKTGLITLSLGKFSFTASVIAFKLIQLAKKVMRS